MQTFERTTLKHKGQADYVEGIYPGCLSAKKHRIALAEPVL
jgi:hypothetical protein